MEYKNNRRYRILRQTQCILVDEAPKRVELFVKITALCVISLVGIPFFYPHAIPKCIARNLNAISSITRRIRVFNKLLRNARERGVKRCKTIHITDAMIIYIRAGVKKANIIMGYFLIF